MNGQSVRLTNLVQSSCIDVEHKKRGRPRLRDERDQRAEGPPIEHQQTSTAMGPPYGSPVLSSPGRGHQRVGSYRELRSQPGIFHHGPQTGLAMPQSYDLGAFRPSAPQLEMPTIPPLAVLSIDLVLAKGNQAFHDAISPGVGIRGRPLLDLLSPNHTAEIQGLQSQLRSERDTKDPTYLPPIRGSAHDLDAISSIDDRDLVNATQGTMERKLYWTFRAPSGQQRNFHFTVKLARTSFFFVVLMLSQGSQYPPPSFSPYAIQDPQRQLQISPVSGSLVRSPILGQVSQYRPFSSGSSQSESPYYSPQGLNLSPESRLLASIPRSSHQEEPRGPQSYMQHHQAAPATLIPVRHTSRSPPPPSTESASYPRSAYERAQDLRHLELPPIQSAAAGRESGHSPRPAHGQHPGQEHTGDEMQQSGGRKRKRQRVGIEEMLG
ncbi:MAG: hypothetical protein M1830_003536 [Pleopsidium flavum]|nr:MAG: hypothetical protein M1830_003536 [Pleopsidium flavum]